MRGVALLAALSVAGCGAPDVRQPAAPDLETAAIARGMVRDPSAFDPVGLYARDTDRLCVVARGGAYRIGAYVDYGEGIACSAAGTARRAGAGLRIDFGGDCRFDAQYDGDRVTFPTGLPDACRALCAGRASFASLSVARLSASGSEAMAMRDPAGRRPCSSG